MKVMRLYDGSPKQIFGVIRDISENRRITEELKRSEMFLIESQQVAHIGSWELDIKNNILKWSDEIFRIIGLEQKSFEVTYENYLNIIHPEDRDIVDKAYADSLKNKTKYNIIHRVLLKDGSIKHVCEMCVTFYSEDGMPIRSLGTIQDITERINIENELIKNRDLLNKTGRMAKVGGWEIEDIRKTFSVSSHKKGLELLIKGDCDIPKFLIGD